MSIEAAVAAAELWPLRKLFHAGDVRLRSQNWFGGGLRRRRGPLDGHRTTNAFLFRPAPVPVRSRLLVAAITVDSTQPSAAAASSDKTIVPDDDFTLAKEIARAPSRSKAQNPATHCLISIGTTAAFQPTPSVAATGPHDASRCMQPLAATTPECSHKAAASYTHGLMIADLDPSTAKLAIGIMSPFLSAFGFLFIVRIVMSWYPKLPVGKFPYVLAYAPTEPFLMVTRKLIPPLGGVDVTPVVWFGLVSFLNEILVGPQGLLVLLSQQV